jgi:hypothetical protein
MRFCLQTTSGQSQYAPSIHASNFGACRSFTHPFMPTRDHCYNGFGCFDSIDRTFSFLQGKPDDGWILSPGNPACSWIHPPGLFMNPKTNKRAPIWLLPVYLEDWHWRMQVSVLFMGLQVPLEACFQCASWCRVRGFATCGIENK